MSDDRPPGNVELLDDWDDDRPTPPRRTRTWLIGPLALVAVVAIVVAVVLGGTKQSALTVNSSPPATPSATSASTVSDPSPTSLVTVNATVPSGAVTYTRVDASGATIMVTPDEYTPEPMSSDLEAEPLVVTLLDKTPRTAAGVIAFNVRVCVSTGSAAMNGGKVTVVRDHWSLASLYTTASPITVGAINPLFPDTSLLGPGQCVSGFVSFAVDATWKYGALWFGDDRFTWTWRVS